MPEKRPARPEAFPRAPAGDGDRDTFGNREFDDARDLSAGEVADEFTAYDYDYSVDHDAEQLDMSEIPTLGGGVKKRTDKPSR